MKRTLEVVLTPALLPLYEVKNKTVVVIDILRATTSICEAFHTGVNRIIPVSTPDECKLFKDFDFLCAAERNALKVEGFDMGNSPFEYQNPLIKGRNIAFTTTNGTKAIKLSKELDAANIAIGSFLNLTFLCDWLIKQDQSVILLCAGWKDKINMEDTLFAGAVTGKIKSNFDINCDSALIAEKQFESSKNDLYNTVLQSSHARRFKELNISNDDIRFCLQTDTMQLIPVQKGEYLERL